MKPNKRLEILDKMHFSIGDQYEKYENHLCDFSVLNFRGQEYVFYKCLITPKSVFKLKIKEILLGFNGDILESIIFLFKDNNFSRCFKKIERAGFKLYENPFECFAEAKSENGKNIHLINIESVNYISFGKPLIKNLLKPCKHK